MPRGGCRPGAGRPKGTKNRRTDMLEEANRMAAETGITPLEYLLKIMRDDEEDQAVRMDAAKAAAPYCHARLTAIHETKGEHTKSHAMWLEEIREEIEEADEEDEGAKSVH